MSVFDPTPVPPPPPPRPRRGWSAASIALIVAAWIAVGLGGLFGLFVLVFLDDCPPASCSTSDAFTAIAAGVGGAVALVVLGTGAVAVCEHRRQPAWPLALATLLASSGSCVAGLAGFYASV